MRILNTSFTVFAALAALAGYASAQNPTAMPTMGPTTPTLSTAPPEDMTSAPTGGGGTETNAPVVEDTMGPGMTADPGMTLDPEGDVTIAPGQNASASIGDIGDIVNGSANFTTLKAAVEAAGLASVLNASGAFTVFAPNDNAFKAMKDTVEKLLKPDWKLHLLDLLTYHVVVGQYMSTDLKSGSIMTVQSENVSIAVTDSSITVNMNPVLTPDIKATNGVIHEIGALLLPRSANKTILDLAVDTSNLSKLVSFIKRVKLDETLMGDGPYTVFGPIDSAWNDTVIANYSDAQLKTLLSYHVVSGIVASGHDGIHESLQGSNITLTASAVNNVTISKSNILGKNGIVHIISGVLKVPANATNTTTKPKDKDAASRVCTGLLAAGLAAAVSLVAL